VNFCEPRRPSHANEARKLIFPRVLAASQEENEVLASALKQLRQEASLAVARTTPLSQRVTRSLVQVCIHPPMASCFEPRY
jgi:hypothetical protein